MVRKRLIFLLLSCFFLGTTFGQQKVDSIISTLPKITDQVKLLDAYNQLVDLLWHDSPSLAISYADTAYLLSQKLNYPEGRLLALANMGIAQYTQGDYQKAAQYYQSAMLLGDKEKIPNEVELYYLNLLKKQGNYAHLYAYLDSLYTKDQLYQQIRYAPTLLDVEVELGNMKEAAKWVRPIFKNERYQSDDTFKGNANLVLSRYYEATGSYDSATLLINDAIDIYRKTSDHLSEAQAIMQLGVLKLTQGIVKSSQILLDSSLHMYEKLKYPFGVAETKRNLAEFYSSIAENDRATHFYFEALEIFEEQNNLNEIAKIYNSLAWIYQAQGSYSSAFDFITRTIDLSNKMDNSAMLAAAYNTYGTFLDLTDSLPKALEMYDKSYQISKKARDKRRVAASFYNLAYVNEKLGNFDKVLDIYKETYQIEIDLGNKIGMGISEFTLGNFYTKRNQFELAEKYLKKSIRTLEAINSKDYLLQSYRYTAQLYNKMGKYKDAIPYYQKYIDLKEQLTNETISGQLAEMEVKYELKNKDREIDYLNLENKSRAQELNLKQTTINNQRLFIGFIVIGSALLIILLVVSYRLLTVKNKSNKDLKRLNKQIQEKNEEIMTQAEELQEANEQISSMNQVLEGRVDKRTLELKQAYRELDTFFYRSSHDFRRPLTTFLGLAEVAKSTLSDSYALDLFNKVETTALQLDKMVYKLKAMSLISSDVLDQSIIDFETILAEILSKHLPKHDQINVQKVINITKPFVSYKELIEIILEDVIENAIQYRNESNPIMTVDIQSNNDHVYIRVSDNGIGIANRFHKRVFDMYYRANESSQGNGLGLYLVQKAVNKLNGEINLQSTDGEGTTITINIPHLT